MHKNKTAARQNILCFLKIHFKWKFISDLLTLRSNIYLLLESSLIRISVLIPSAYLAVGHSFLASCLLDATGVFRYCKASYTVLPQLGVSNNVFITLSFPLQSLSGWGGYNWIIWFFKFWQGTSICHIVDWLVGLSFFVELRYFIHFDSDWCQILNWSLIGWQPP